MFVSLTHKSGFDNVGAPFKPVSDCKQRYKLFNKDEKTVMINNSKYLSNSNSTIPGYRPRRPAWGTPPSTWRRATEAPSVGRTERVQCMSGEMTQGDFVKPLRGVGEIRLN